MSPYLTIAEAAELLRTTPATVRNKMSAGIFVEGVHYFRPRASAPLFKRDALIAFVEQKEEKSAPRLRMAGGYELGSGPSVRALPRATQDDRQ